MNLIVVTTNIASVVEREYTKADGTKGPVTVLKYPLKDRQKIDGEWKNVTVAFCESSAFDDQAKQWAKAYEEGTPVEIIGKLVKVEQWDRKNGDGVGLTHVIRGQTGGAPIINWVPKDFRGQNGNGNGNGHSGPDSEPDF